MTLSISLLSQMRRCLSYVRVATLPIRSIFENLSQPAGSSNRGQMCSVQRICGKRPAPSRVQRRNGVGNMLIKGQTGSSHCKYINPQDQTMWLQQGWCWFTELQGSNPLPLVHPRTQICLREARPLHLAGEIRPARCDFECSDTTNAKLFA